MTPKVSIIVPNYNHSLYLKERLDSIFNQTYQNFEVIILDDCSTDNSNEIIELYRYHEKVSHIIYNDTNSGSTFKQWKKGFELARGNFIWVAESDDIAKNNILENLYSRIKQDNNISFAFCNSIKINENSEVISKNNWLNDLNIRDWNTESFTNTGSKEIENYLFYKNIVPNASSALIRKSLVPNNVFDEIIQMKYAGDWLFWIRLAEVGCVSFCNEFLNGFRHHQNTTRTSKNKISEITRFKEYLFVIKYVKNKYGFKWNLSKHSWILNEFKSKFNSFNSKEEFNLLINFPLPYMNYLLINDLKMYYEKLFK